MAHFVRLDENNVIIETVYVGNQDILDSNGNESEEIGQNICRGLRVTSNCIWKQTSFSNSFRCRYAGPGMVYDEEYDVFYHQKPYPSWILNTQDFVCGNLLFQNQNLRKKREKLKVVIFGWKNHLQIGFCLRQNQKF